MKKCNRCKQEYNSKLISYAWKDSYCCVECFLNMSKPKFDNFWDILEEVPSNHPIYACHKKFKMVQSTSYPNLFQIVSLNNFGNVKKGELGGHISKESNLDHNGSCWISEQTIILDNAKVCDDAYVGGMSVVKDNAIIRQGAIVEDCFIENNVTIQGYVSVKKQTFSGWTLIQ